MKKATQIIIPIILVLAIIVCTGWYLFVYDREFTRDMLLHAARRLDDNGKHTVAAWFYDCAYKQADDNDAVAIELAEQYKASGNYTKAEYTLTKAIADGGGVELYIALSKTFVEQDKLMDAVKMLDNVKNTAVKEQLDILRPAAPICTPGSVDVNAYYTQYITVTVSAEKGTLYVSSNGEFPSVEKDLYTQGITLKDGANTIHAVTVSDNGLVSPSAIFGFTVGGVIEKVSFADGHIEAALREALNAPADKVLYTDDLWQIKEFSVPENTQDLSDLRHLVFLEKLNVANSVSGQLSAISALANLKELSVTNTSVSAEELKQIGKLPGLQKLTISNCGLSTVAGLETAAELTYLDLSNNAIRDITPLGSLLKIQTMNLSHNALNDLTPLSVASTLTDLNISHNNLTTLTPITSIVGLKVLAADNNKVTELTGFQQLTALQTLSLSNNAITGIPPISSCTEITKLEIANNALKDISALSSLKKLTDLNFANNKVTKLPQWNSDCALVNIDGSYNQLSSLEPLKGLRHLNNVFMDYNREISSIKALANCPMLIQVNVYGTKVTQVSALTSQSIVVNYDPTR